MSLFEDIYNDFPLRCADVWRLSRASAKAEGREVTLMLMAATAGLAMPWEHLRIQEGQAKNNRGHPAFEGFREPRYRRALKSVERAVRPVLGASPLFERTDFSTWYWGRATTIAEIRDMLESRPPPSDLLEQQTARQVINLLRNALAHNNLHAFGGPDRNEIEDLAFFCEITAPIAGSSQRTVTGYKVLSMPVRDFETFLENWFNLLSRVSSRDGAASDRRGTALRLVISQALQDADERAAA